MIYAKLLEFQKKNITIAKDAQNPHFKSRYSSLNEVLEKVKKPLNEMGVVIIQKAGAGLAPDAHGLYTTLLDTEDGSDLTCFVPFVGATDMQKLGGAITYARRYSLVTLLGLEDADDDGETASAPRPAPRAAQKANSPVDINHEPFGELQWDTKGLT